MQPVNIINQSLTYIEENLKTEITTDELADMAGYSVWHYQRLFSQMTGTPVAVYIGKRRLDRALKEIAGGRRAIDVALEYGFDTYAGFYKAFVKIYGDSPKKKILKTEVSIMFNKQLFNEQELRDILLNWDIPQDLPILDVYIIDGTEVSGNVWSIGEEYILKAGNRESLLKNLNIVKALATQGFMAATPITTKSGTEYVDGQQIVILSRGVKGSPLSKNERFGVKRQDYGRKYGESIARLHKVLKSIEAEVQPKNENLYSTVTDWVLKEVKKQNKQYQMGLSEQFFEGYINNFKILHDKLPKQLIHRDPNPSNILFDDKEVSGFIDFDLSECNVRLWDPCYCATGLLSEWRGVEGIFEKWPEILSAILHGYDSVNPLSAEEKQAVYYVLCAIEMICLAYFEGNDKLKDVAKVNREMLMYIVKNEVMIKGLI